MFEDYAPFIYEMRNVKKLTDSALSLHTCRMPQNIKCDVKLTSVLRLVSCLIHLTFLNLLEYKIKRKSNFQCKLMYSNRWNSGINFLCSFNDLLMCVWS